ncbi:hypothetical protein RDV89_13655 [Nocardioides zeae]|uniref:Transposase n=1 Tax=Nocardioides imazamoxiresistens TaxID=3231893 RepID=A0ABU3PY04_9ACTN|nr:hypothetical protein [Nocardioides zeae]MDT9594123.1 hypothetical protein [Nocardioides zeae]
MREPSVEHGAMRAARVQHVWVDITGHWVHPQPGVLMMWRRRHGKRPGWEAFVVTVDATARAHGGSPNARIGWVDAAHVRPTAGPSAPR